MKKSKLIAIGVIIVSVIVIVSLITINSRPYLQVSQVASNPSQYHNREIQVIGVAQGFSGGNFNLIENEYSIIIDISGIPIPNDLENGIQVVVTGLFDSSLVIVATQVHTQCS
ncbi:MAG: cytochrome c maturation protein CcmE [Candidatus Lokiarchaeota archaeon]|nr:cytochrome c maturation protein CcmE [Candidatus Lokiarchaeota archaeon]